MREAGIEATPRRDLRIDALLFGLFFLSGFCSLVYQIIWLRMAFAHFGVITPVLSTVISVFMLGLGIGSLLAGRYGGALRNRLGCSAATLYGITELLIGLGAFAVPWSMGFGQHLLLDGDAGGSARYLALSSIAIAFSILPWCVLMGATFPLMMGFVRTGWRDPDQRIGKTRSFSFLYGANVTGAAAGTLLSAGVLIEMLGFRGTGLFAALTNFLIGAIGIRLGTVEENLPSNVPVCRASVRPAAGVTPAIVPANLILFTTGFCSLAMEVVWTRGFTIVLKTTIYAFAAILATYLISTATGAALYRRRVRRGTVPSDSSLLLAACFTACVPAILDDPRVQMNPLGVLLSIVPFSVVLGILTPRLVDAASLGDPGRAATSYTMNILGSILGPLVAGYLLVNRFDVRICLLLLALPLIALAAWSVLVRSRTQRLGLAICLGVLALSFGFARSYESSVSGGQPFEIRRDYAATAIAYGTGMQKTLLVNGVGITALTPITKIMADLPLAVHGHAQRGLVICFGMGTTLRTMSRWGIDTTVVDLTGSVIRLFGFFHADAPAVAGARNVHIVVDDGRRYLNRVGQTYDVIVIDPPPPVEAAGSSLLYSREMYEVVRRRLRPGGILQQWYPGNDDATGQAVARTLSEAFPYVVAYRSIVGLGTHYLASMQPVPDIDAATFVSRMPESARHDLVEWDPQTAPLAMAVQILAGRQSIAGPHQGAIITDDRPYNEYYLTRSVMSASR